MRSVSFRHGETIVLDNASLHVPKGAMCVVTGANASGKSTLLYVSAGLVKPESGECTLGGHRANLGRPSDLFRKGIRLGLVFQEGGMLSNMNALANVALPLRYHADVLGISVREIEQRARAALDRVGLTRSEMYALPAHLSFGVRKRLALARAIALNPNFFFFDDPDVGLDQDTAAIVHEILCRYRDDPEVTCLVATNRDILVDRLGVPGYTLQNGRLYERGRPRSVPPASQRLA